MRCAVPSKHGSEIRENRSNVECDQSITMTVRHHVSPVNDREGTCPTRITHPAHDAQETCFRFYRSRGFKLKPFGDLIWLPLSCQCEGSIDGFDRTNRTVGPSVHRLNWSITIRTTGRAASRDPSTLHSFQQQVAADVYGSSSRRRTKQGPQRSTHDPPSLDPACPRGGSRSCP